MYNFPCCKISNIKHFIIAKTLENKLWVKCLAEFLIDIKFYLSKTEVGHIAETKENPSQ